MKDLKVEELREQRDKIDFLIDMKSQTDTLEGQIAIDLHKYECDLPHEDRCGWEHEFKHDEHNWDGIAHHEYLMKARSMIATWKESLGK